MDLPFGRFYFKVEGELGEGGLGSVDRIRITESNSPNKPVGSCWARKRLSGKWKHHPEAVERFEREISALKRMSHPNIMAYSGEDIGEGDRFYVMPLYDNSVRKHIAAGSWTSEWRSVARQGVTLSEALEYAHSLGSRGYIHRDIKPDNILFNPGEPLILADWGIGYFVHKDSVVLTHLTRGFMGTEYYCSREQWITGKCDQRGDIYALGMTLDEWVRGQQVNLLVPGDGIQTKSVNATSLGASRFNLTIKRMTARDPDDRIDSMRDVRAALRW